MNINMEHHCVKCIKSFAIRKDLTDHNSIMRRQGKVEGHEVQTKTGSQVDSREKKKSNDFLPPFAPGLISKKVATILDEKDLDMYNSD
jgi:hypothetical protein